MLCVVIFSRVERDLELWGQIVVSLHSNHQPGFRRLDLPEQTYMAKPRVTAVFEDSIPLRNVPRTLMFEPMGLATCPQCGGRGMYLTSDIDGHELEEPEHCGRCHGDGYVELEIAADPNPW